MKKSPLFSLCLLLMLLELSLPSRSFPLPTRDTPLTDEASAVIDRQVVPHTPAGFALAIHRSKTPGDKNDRQKREESIGGASAYFTPLDSIRIELPLNIYIKFSYTGSTMEERIAESYYAELEIEKTDEKIRAIRKELEDLKRKELGGTGLDEPQYVYPPLPPEKGPKTGPSSPPPEKEMAESGLPPRAGAYGGSSSGREEEKGTERGSRAGLGPDVFEKQTFFDRMLKMAMKIVGFISNHPIAVLSLLVLYALLADLLGRARGWGER